MAGQERCLVGDIGGTNARFALVDRGSCILRDIRVMPCKDYDNLDDAVRQYLGDLGVVDVRESCIAFASPVDEDVIKLTNADWRFSRRDMQNRLGLQTFKVLNDFTAMALGVPAVDANELFRIGGSEIRPGKPRLVIGPGTGLGVSALVPSGEQWIPLSTEGGHVDLAAVTETEIEVLRRLQGRYGRVSAERAISGEGLENLYWALSAMQGSGDGQGIRQVAPVITSTALDGSDPLAVQTLEMFCTFFGRVAGNAALTIGATGAVYICGGIAPRILDFLSRSGFRTAFEEKGRMRHLLQPVPIFVVTENYTGLIGAAAALVNPAVA